MTYPRFIIKVPGLTGSFSSSSCDVGEGLRLHKEIWPDKSSPNTGPSHVRRRTLFNQSRDEHDDPLSKVRRCTPLDAMQSFPGEEPVTHKTSFLSVKVIITYFPVLTNIPFLHGADERVCP